jgi:hypothetical protein
MIRPDLTVADLGELSTVHVSGVAEGANAWVESTKTYYTLQKNFTGAPPMGSVAPLGGSPSAGAASALWVPQATGGGSGPSASANQLVWVTQGGSDVTGDGTVLNPFFTVAHAMTTITDSAILKRYAILTGPGVYSDPIALKPWVYIVGLGVASETRLSGAITFDPAWTPAGDHRAGFQNCLFTTAQAFDFNPTASNEGKLTFTSCTFNAKPTFTAFSAINQVTLEECFSFDGYTQNGINMTLANTRFQNGGTIALVSINDGRNLPTLLSAFGGGTDGPMTVTWTAPPMNDNHMAVALFGFGMQGPLTIDGANISLHATSLPDVITLANSAVPPICPNTTIQQGLALTDGAGSSTVLTPFVTPASRFMLTWQDGGNVPAGVPYIASRVPGVSFTIQGTGGGADAGVNVYWQIWQP